MIEVTSERPLALGMWEFEIAGDGMRPKRLTWAPGDAHLMWEGRPMLGAPVNPQTPKAARATAHALAAKLNAT